MTTIQPQGDALRKAVQWVAEQRKENPDKSSAALADEAAFKYDLSPKDSEFLLRFIREENS